MTSSLFEWKRSHGFGSINTSPYPTWIQAHEIHNKGLIYPNSLNPPGGNVGIGTTSPVSALHVNSGVTNTSDFGTSYTSNVATANTNGTYTNYGFEAVLTPVISSGVTNYGSAYGGWVNGYRGSASDLGTLGNFYGLGITYGHYGATSRTTTNAAGLAVYPLHQGGTISYSYGLFLGNAATGGTAINYYGIYQQDTAAKNYFAGNVGIGTTLPSGKLDVDGSFVTSPGVITVRAQDASAEGGQISLSPGGARTTTWHIDNYDDRFRIFSTADRFTVLSNGNVGIGTTSPGATLDVQGSSQWPLRLRNTGSSAGNYWSIGPDTNNHLVVYNQSIVGMYMANGSTTWSSNSDRRVKKNFLPISDALEKTLQLRGLTYHYKTDADTDPRRVGVIAQEVQRVLPEAVSEHDGILGVASC